MVSIPSVDDGIRPKRFSFEGLQSRTDNIIATISITNWTNELGLQIDISILRIMKQP